MTRKMTFLGLLFVVLTMMLVGCKKESTNSALPKEIRIGTIRVPNDKQVAINQRFFDNYFKDKGIETKFIFFDSGVAANQAFASGSIDFAEMGYTNAVVACSQKLPVELIWIHDVLGENEALVAQEKLGITSVKELKGKKIATPFSSTSHFSLLKALEEAGIEKAVTLLDMETTEIVAAWERGDIDAAYTWDPTLSKLKQTGTVLTDSQQLADQGYVTTDIELVNSNFSKKYPELVTDYLRALNQAVTYYQENPKAAIQAAANQLEITEEEAEVQMQAIKWLDLEEQISAPYLGTNEKSGQFLKNFLDTANFLKEQGAIQTVPTEKEIQEFIRPTYIEKAIK